MSLPKQFERETYSDYEALLKEALSIAWEALENHGHIREDDCIYHEAMRRIEELGK